MNEIKLGDKVVSKTSGFAGTVTGIINYLYSETKYEVTAPQPVDGEVEITWFALAELSIAE